MSLGASLDFVLFAMPQTAVLTAIHWAVQLEALVLSASDALSNCMLVGTFPASKRHMLEGM